MPQTLPLPHASGAPCSLPMLGSWTHPSRQPRVPAASHECPLLVGWARHLDEVREAQRLRWRVFAGEMGARLPRPSDPALAGHDIDRFDAYCEHLLVRHGPGGPVIGTYRVLTPTQAHRAGGTYSDGEFDLAPLAALRPRMVELGRSCVHPAHREGGVILALWGALARFMARNVLHTMLGCASVPLGAQGPADLQRAAAVWHRLHQTHLAPTALQVVPRLPLPLAGRGAERVARDAAACATSGAAGHATSSATSEPTPPLILAYLRMRARVLGAPAWDPDFSSADLPLLLRLDDMPPRYRRHLLAGDAAA